MNVVHPPWRIRGAEHVLLHFFYCSEEHIRAAENALLYFLAIEREAAGVDSPTVQLSPITIGLVEMLDGRSSLCELAEVLNNPERYPQVTRRDRRSPAALRRARPLRRDSGI